MSSYLRITKHPKTKKFETARWIDDHFGQHNYGVEFEDGTVVDPEKVTLETKEGKTEKDWNWNPWPAEEEDESLGPISEENKRKIEDQGREISDVADRMEGKNPEKIDPDEILERLRQLSVEIQESNMSLNAIDRDVTKWKKKRSEISDGLHIAYQDVVRLKSRHLTTEERTFVLVALKKADLKGPTNTETHERIVKKLSGSDIMLGASLKE